MTEKPSLFWGMWSATSLAARWNCGSESLKFVKTREKLKTKAAAPIGEAATKEYQLCVFPLAPEHKKQRGYNNGDNRRDGAGVSFRPFTGSKN